jgi:hypothetical protein
MEWRPIRSLPMTAAADLQAWPHARAGYGKTVRWQGSTLSTSWHHEGSSAPVRRCSSGAICWLCANCRIWATVVQSSSTTRRIERHVALSAAAAAASSGLAAATMAQVTSGGMSARRTRERPLVSTMMLKFRTSQSMMWQPWALMISRKNLLVFCHAMGPMHIGPSDV